MRKSLVLLVPLCAALAVAGCGTAMETRDEPLQLSQTAISAVTPLGLPLGKDKATVDEVASSEWGVRPQTCTNGNMNTSLIGQQQQMSLTKTNFNICSYVDSECDDVSPPGDARVRMYRCDYPNTLAGVDGREMVLTFIDKQLAEVGVYDSFIDEPTARASGDSLIHQLNALLHVPALLTKPGRTIASSSGAGTAGVITQRVSWSTPDAEVRVELIELTGHVWSVGYTTISRDLAVWYAGTDESGQARMATDDLGVTVAGAGALGGVSATSRQLAEALEVLVRTGDSVGLCMPASDRPPPQNANNSSVAY